MRVLYPRNTEGGELIKASCSPSAFIAICFVAVVAINLGGTRVYGETEFCEFPICLFTRLAAYDVASQGLPGELSTSALFEC